MGHPLRLAVCPRCLVDRQASVVDTFESSASRLECIVIQSVVALAQPKLCSVPNDATCGIIGAPIALRSRVLQSTPVNQRWLMTSRAPPRRLPRRFDRSAVNRRLMRSFAYGSIWLGKAILLAKIYKPNPCSVMPDRHGGTRVSHLFINSHRMIIEEWLAAERNCVSAMSVYLVYQGATYWVACQHLECQDPQCPPVNGFSVAL